MGSQIFNCLSGDSCKLTPLQLETLLTEGGTSRYWLVSSMHLVMPVLKSYMQS